MIKQAKALKESYKTQIQRQYKYDLLTIPLLMSTKIYFWDLRKRDCDNYGKLINDSLQWTILIDDNQIKLNVTEILYDKKNPRVEIEFYEYLTHKITIEKSLAL